MKLALSDEDVAFRDELRRFYATEIPAEIRERVQQGEPDFPDDMITSQRILHANAGGAELACRMGRKGLDAAATPDLAGRDAAGRCPRTVGLQHQDGRPGDCSVRLAGDEGALPAADRKPGHLVVSGLLEPEAGSDLASLRTTAVRDGDSYVVNGQKTWTTLGQHADWIFLLARTNPDAPKKQAGISFLLAEMSTPGITLRPIELIDGSFEVNEVFFEDVRIPAGNLVGEENQG